MKTTWEVTVKEKNGSVLHPSYTGEDVTREDVIKFFDLEGDDVESYELRLVSEDNGKKISYNEKKVMYDNILKSVDKIIKKRLITEDLNEDDDWDFDNDENTELTDDIKRKVEKYLKQNEGAVSIEWGEDSCTIFDENGIAIEDFMIDVEDDGEIYYTPVSTPSVTLCIEDDDDDDDDFLDEDNNWNSDVDEYDDDLLGENNNWNSEDEDDDYDFDNDENTELTDEIKRKVEKYLKKNEGAVTVEWGEDSCTIFDKNGIAIEDFMIDVEDDGEIYYTPVSTPSVTLCIEDDDDDDSTSLNEDDDLDFDNDLTDDIKRKVEKYLKKNEGAVTVEWGDGSCTIFDKNGIAIEDFMIDVEDDGEIYYTPVSTPSVTLCIEDDEDDD